MNGVKKHMSTMLSIFGIIGVFGTAALSVKATTKAMSILKDENDEKVKNKEIVKTYIPAVSLGLLTSGCILSANVLNKKQQATLSIALSAITSKYKNYRNSTIELFGDDADKRILDNIEVSSQKNISFANITQNYDSKSDILLHDSNTKKIFYDDFSERYFEARPIDVLMAEYHLNRNFALGFDVYLNDFYDFLGLEHTEIGNILGWDLEFGIGWIDFIHKKKVINDDFEVIFISSIFPPDRIEERYQVYV